MQPDSDPPVVIVLAAGCGERFAASGGRVHKLQALLAGKAVLEHVLDAVRASDLPFYVVRADPRLPGMGDSIAAGVRATLQASGWLILPGDLTLVKPATLRAVADRLAIHSAVLPVCGGVRGHPVGFSAACRTDLLNLEGNQGAASVLRAQAAMNLIAFIAVDDAGTLTDIDTLDDLHRAELLLSKV